MILEIRGHAWMQLQHMKNLQTIHDKMITGVLTIHKHLYQFTDSHISEGKI